MSGHGGVDPSELRWAKRKLVRPEGEVNLDSKKMIPPSALAIVTSKPSHQYPSKMPETVGFRHFIRAPASDSEVLGINGENPVNSAQALKDLRELMARLASRLENPFSGWKSHDVNNPAKYHGDARRLGTLPLPEENPNLPAGYTYFLQLVAHDMVQTSLAISILEDATTGVHNARHIMLRLDSIYGDGPTVCPAVYALDDTADGVHDGTRTMLRLGRMTDVKADGTSHAKGAGEFRDIARLGVANLTGKGAGTGLCEPLIADPRNDAHAILAQMTALFHHLHNGILEARLPTRIELEKDDSKWEAAFDRYLCARQAVTLIYRNIIRKDLMSRILHPEINRLYQGYGTDASKYLDYKYEESADAHANSDAEPKKVLYDRRVPLEFTHGAFRFAHVMVRDRYQLNASPESKFHLFDILLQTSSKNPDRMPLNTNWIVQWSRFFMLADGSSPMLSRRIGPSFHSQLDVFDAIDPTKSKRLAYRDFMSGSFVGLWSIEGLIEEISSQRPELVALSPFATREKRRELIDKCLRSASHLGLTDADIKKLSNDPPLLLFVLCEAACDDNADGLRLGVFGSIIVAETIFGALNFDPLPAEVGSESLAQSLSKLSGAIFEKNFFNDEITEIDCMEKLIKYTAKLANLEEAQPAFL